MPDMKTIVNVIIFVRQKLFERFGQFHILPVPQPFGQISLCYKSSTIFYDIYSTKGGACFRISMIDGYAYIPSFHFSEICFKQDSRSSF